jgi:hypothetical protein
MNQSGLEKLDQPALRALLAKQVANLLELRASREASRKEAQITAVTRAIAVTAAKIKLDLPAPAMPLPAQLKFLSLVQLDILLTDQVKQAISTGNLLTKNVAIIGSVAGRKRTQQSNNVHHSEFAVSRNTVLRAKSYGGYRWVRVETGDAIVT